MTRILPAAVHGAGAACCALLLWAAGQPIFTDDLWWHLALGDAFAAAGPWLAEDPLLFAPAGPPRPASWLFDVVVAQVAASAGFAGLRGLHLVLVAGILGLAWSLLRATSGSNTWASLGVAVFVGLSAYRLVQLRPHLCSILAGLLVIHWLLLPGGPPSWRRVAAAAGLAGLWANLHAAFLLGPALLGAALAGLLGAAPGRGAEERRADAVRGRRLAAAGALLLAATLANPAGVSAHLAYLAAGVGTPALDLVVDEWSPVSLWRLPTGALPPSPLAWGLVWLLGVGTLLTGARRLGPARRGPRPAPDPALFGVALLALPLLLAASRFLWLGILPLLWLGHAARRGPDPGREPGAAAPWAWASAACALLLVPGFLRLGDWPAVTRGLPTSLPGYARPFPTGKYHAHAIWFLADSGVGGNLYHDYYLGGFAGYWLAPSLRTAVNGSLNVPAERLGELGALAARRGARPDESFEALLDRLDIDVFLGIRLPETGPPHRPWAATTAHLEQTPGWVTVFRNLDSAVYLRSDARHAGDLARVARYYAARGVPFDPERGFSVEAVLRESPRWAVAHGLVPQGFARLTATARTRGAAGASARDRLAALHAALGDYEGAIALDGEAAAARPDAVRPRRRLVWSLLRLGRYADAAREAAALERGTRRDALSRIVARVAREVGGLEAGPARARIAQLPLLSRSEAAWLVQGVRSAPTRPARSR